MGEMTRNHSSLTRQVVKALGIFGSLEGLNMLCAVLRSKLMALWVGTAGVGVIALFNSTLELMRTMTMFNLKQGGVREIASAPAAERPMVCHAVGRLALWLGLGGMVIVAMLSPLLSMAAFDTYDYTWAFALLSLTMVASAIAEGRKTVLQAMGQLKDLAKASLYGAVTSTVLSLPLVYFFRMQAIVPMLMVFSAFTLLFLMLPKTARPSRRPAPAYVRTKVRALVKLGSYLTAALLAGMGAEYALRIYLSLSSSVDTVGQFQAGYVLINSYVGVIFTAISMEFYPRLSATIHRTRTTSVLVRHEINTMLWILIPVVAVFICTEELIVRILYSEAFLPVLPFLSLAIMAMFFKAVSWCYSYVILAKGDGKVYVMTETLSAVCLVVFSYIGWSRWGFAGLGAAYLAQFIVFTLATWAVARHRYRLTLGRNIWLILLAGIAIAAVTFLAKHFLGPWLTLAIALPLLLPLTYRQLKR